MSGLQPYEQRQTLSKDTKRALGQQNQQWVIDTANEKRKQTVVADRLETGAAMTGELCHWLGVLGHQQVTAGDQLTFNRMGHAIDQLAINGAQVIGQYMRGKS